VIIGNRRLKRTLNLRSDKARNIHISSQTVSLKHSKRNNCKIPTAITTTYIPPNSPITVTLRITQRTNRIKSYEKIPTRSINRCKLIPLCNTREKLPSSSLPSILTQ
jgi:hypothetical protein